jgi:hypothetical protein
MVDDRRREPCTSGPPAELLELVLAQLVATLDVAARLIEDRNRQRPPRRRQTLRSTERHSMTRHG